MNPSDWKGLFAIAAIILAIGGCGRLMQQTNMATDVTIKLSADMAKEGYEYCGYLKWCKIETQKNGGK